MSTVTREARLFEAGDYPDKGFSANAEADLDAIIAASRAHGPAPVRMLHAETDSVLDMGACDPASLRREGRWLLGQVTMPADLFAKLKTRRLSVGIDRAGRFLSEVSLTPHPRVAGAALFGESGDLFVFEEATIMPEGNEILPGGAAPDAQVEEKVEHGIRAFFSRLLGTQEAEKPAPAPPPVATFDEAAMQARIDEAVAKAVKPLREQTATFAEERLETLRGDYVRRGAPPAVVNLLAPFAAGNDTATFGEETVGFAEAAKRALEASCGIVPSGGQLRDVDRQEDVTFADRAAARASQLKREHPDWNMAKCQEMADDEMTRKEVA